MLMTQDKGKTWLITQPAHGRVAGYMAAHWGNEKFASPGYFADSPSPERLRAEVVLAIGEHDNGWWEWEANPSLSASDGLPKGLFEVLGNPEEAAERWRIGVTRFEENHPYACVVIGWHPHWLSQWALGKAEAPFLHPVIFGKRPNPSEEGRRVAAALLDRLAVDRERLTEEIQNRESWEKDGLRSEHLHPHARLLQILDSMSLALCSDAIPTRSGQGKGLGRDEIEFDEVPRQSWEDRVTLHLRPVGERQIELSPYPFDVDPLPVPVVARIVDSSSGKRGDYRLKGAAIPEQVVMYEFRSKG